jgi:hypothetical protein
MDVNEFVSNSNETVVPESLRIFLRENTDVAYRIAKRLTSHEYLTLIISFVANVGLHKLNENIIAELVELKWLYPWREYDNAMSVQMPQRKWRLITFMLQNGFDGYQINKDQQIHIKFYHAFSDAIQFEYVTPLTTEARHNEGFPRLHVHDAFGKGISDVSIIPDWARAFGINGRNYYKSELPAGILFGDIIYAILSNGWNRIQIKYLDFDAEKLKLSPMFDRIECANCQAANPRHICRNFENCGARYCDQDCANQHWQGKEKHYLKCSSVAKKY